jgi:hypothetical protein
MHPLHIPIGDILRSIERPDIEVWRVAATGFKIDLNTACEPGFAETPGSVTRTLCPVFWSKMRYSPGEDVASFSMLTLAATRLSAASRQSTSPIKSILKISKEGTTWLLAS